MPRQQQYEDDLSDIASFKNQSPANVLGSIVRHKVAPHQEKEFVRTVLPKYQPSIDIVKPQDGVVVIQNDDKVRGRKYTSASVDLTGRTRAKEDANSQQLTMKQYKKQLKKSGLADRDVQSTKENFETEEGDRVFQMVSHQDKSPQKVKFEGKEPVKSAPVKPVQKTGEVRVHSTKLRDILQKETVGGSVTERIPRSNLITEKPPLRTAVDEFNLEIMNSVEWGSNVREKKDIEPYVFPKIDQRQLKSTLGIKPKYPRDRGIVHSSLSIQKSSGNASRSVTRIRPTADSPTASFFQ